MVPVIVIVSLLTFGLIMVLPGDPAMMMLGEQVGSDSRAYDALRAQLGLDRPLPIQYLDWAAHAVRGDFGSSYLYHAPVSGLIKERLPITLTLGGTGLVIALVVSIPLGILAAMREG